LRTHIDFAVQCVGDILAGFKFVVVNICAVLGIANLYFRRLFFRGPISIRENKTTANISAYTVISFKLRIICRKPSTVGQVIRDIQKFEERHLHTKYRQVHILNGRNS